MKYLGLLLGALSSATLLTACGGRSLAPAAPGLGPNAVTNAGSGYKLLYRFKGPPDGASPLSGLLSFNGTIYGTTLQGSPNSSGCFLGCGTVFTVSTTGSEHVIYDFKGGSDGLWPFAGLTALNGTLYGDTGGGGAHSEGSVFSVSTSGSENVVYSFAGGNDGYDPEANLIAVNGTLYGTTVYGGGSGCGGNGCGTVFSIAPGGTETVLYRFAGGTDGARVYAPLTYMGGKLYGATLEGGGSGCGGSGCGTIFKLTLAGKEHVIYSFGAGTNGAFPNGLTAVHGVLYGTTEGGGSKNSGTFFSVTRAGSEKLLYTFTDIPDGNLPGATLLYLKGMFYGTTVGGGTSGNGTVFAVDKSGNEHVLHSFAGGTDGAAPQAAVIAVNGKLYSTTYKGGGTGCSSSVGCGTVFRIRI